MPLFARFSPLPGVVVALWRRSESETELETLIPERYRSFYRSRLSVLTDQGRRLEWLAVRALLHSELPQVEALDYVGKHKPHLSHGPHVSISHTGPFVALAWSGERKVGVDIELIQERVMRLAPRYTCAAEREGDWTLSRAMVLWTGKEALYKLHDILSSFKEDIFIPPFVPEESGRVSFPVRKVGHSCALHYHFFPDFALSLAVDA